MKIRKILALAIGMCIIMTESINVYAAEYRNDQTLYAENHYQLNFTEVNAYIENGERLILEPKETSLFARKSNTEVLNEISMLENTMENDPALVEILINGIQSGELMAISVTEAPVVFVNDHYERVLLSNARSFDFESSYDKAAKEGYFFLYTTVWKSYTANSNGTYDYTTTTIGRWSENSALGHSDYPASGEDFILQSTPNTWTRKSKSLEVDYSDGSDGVEGKEFRFCDGGPNFVKCAIEDDPFGMRQNTGVILTCVSAGNKSSEYRMINSYYIHTWASLGIDVTVGATSAKEVSLNITPTIEKKSWQIYNEVVFEF